MNDKTQPLVELIYYSHSINTLTQDDFELLLKDAQLKNTENSITGAIVYGEGTFIQLVEGPRDNVNRLFQSISHDARHYDVSLIAFNNVSERRFPDWSMSYLDKDVKAVLGLDKDFNLINIEDCLALFSA